MAELIRKYGPVVARYLAGFLVAFLIAQLNKVGIDISPEAAEGFTVGLSALFLAILTLGILRTKKDDKRLVDNTVNAALTGEVPLAIASKATPEQVRMVEDTPHTTIV